MSFLVPELRLLFHEERAKHEREREEQRKPVIPEKRANTKEESVMKYEIAGAGLTERRELSKRRPGAKARVAAVVLATILPALVGASGTFAEPMGDAVRKFDAFLAQQAASADGANIFADAQDEYRTAFELELQQHEALRNGFIEVVAGQRPKMTIMPPLRSPAPGVAHTPLPRREPASFQLDQIARCLRALSWSLGALQLRLEVQMQAIRQELKRER